MGAARWILAMIFAGWLIAFGATDCRWFTHEHAAVSHHHKPELAMATGHAHVEPKTPHTPHDAALAGVLPRTEFSPAPTAVAVVPIAAVRGPGPGVSTGHRAPRTDAPPGESGRDVLTRFCISRR